ncbi:hypothetical protein ACA910_008789 [Epithemia clementina (nom. ined.)]
MRNDQRNKDDCILVLEPRYSKNALRSKDKVMMVTRTPTTPSKHAIKRQGSDDGVHGRIGERGRIRGSYGRWPPINVPSNADLVPATTLPVGQEDQAHEGALSSAILNQNHSEDKLQEMTRKIVSSLDKVGLKASRSALDEQQKSRRASSAPSRRHRAKKAVGNRAIATPKKRPQFKKYPGDVTISVAASFGSYGLAESCCAMTSNDIVVEEDYLWEPSDPVAQARESIVDSDDEQNDDPNNYDGTNEIQTNAKSNVENNAVQQRQPNIMATGTHDHDEATMMTEDASIVIKPLRLQEIPGAHSSMQRFFLAAMAPSTNNSKSTDTDVSTQYSNSPDQTVLNYGFSRKSTPRELNHTSQSAPAQKESGLDEDDKAMATAKRFVKQYREQTEPSNHQIGNTQSKTSADQELMATSYPMTTAQDQGGSQGSKKRVSSFKSQSRVTNGTSSDSHFQRSSSAKTTPTRHLANTNTRLGASECEDDEDSHSGLEILKTFSSITASEHLGSFKGFDKQKQNTAIATEPQRAHQVRFNAEPEMERNNEAPAGSNVSVFPDQSMVSEPVSMFSYATSAASTTLADNTIMSAGQDHQDNIFRDMWLTTAEMLGFQQYVQEQDDFSRMTPINIKFFDQAISDSIFPTSSKRK